MTHKKKNIKLIFAIFIISLLTMSIGYSVLSEKLSLTGTAKLKVESDSNSYDIDYSLTSWAAGKTQYQFNPITLTYNGTEDVTTWDMIIEVPDDSTVEACWNARCKIENGKLIIGNSDNNANIKPNQSITDFGFQIATSMTNYELNVEQANFYTATNPNPNERIITEGIEIEYSKNGGWPSGDKFVSQMYINITNSTEYNFNYWELKIKRPNNSTIKALWGASYVEKEDTIVITGENNDTNFQSGKTKSIGVQIEVENEAVELETIEIFGKTIIY